MKSWTIFASSLVAVGLLTAAINSPKGLSPSNDDKGKGVFIRQDLSPLDDLLQKRLHVIDGRNFGVRRIGTANPHDMLVFRPEVPEEMSIIEKYRTQGFEVLIFTAGFDDAYKWLRQPVTDQSGKVTEQTLQTPPVRLGGPVFLDNERAAAFKDGDKLSALALKMLKSESFTESGQKFNEFTLYASPVIGDARCAKCHIDSSGKQVKDDARIGFLIYLVRKVA